MVAVVTGGSRGSGLAIARALVARGESVAIAARKADELQRAAREIGAAGRVHAVPADVRVSGDAEMLVKETVTRFGGLDVLVNNGGIGRSVNVGDRSLDDWHDVIETNLSGVFYCTRAAVPEIRRRGGGCIVNISSLAGKNAFAGAAAYCASKAALNQFSEALMQEVRHDNIRVSYVMPGSVATGFGEPNPSGEDAWKLTPGDVAKAVLDVIS